MTVHSLKGHWDEQKIKRSTKAMQPIGTLWIIFSLCGEGEDLEWIILQL